MLIDEMFPLLAEAGLAEFCDGCCDDGYYTVEDSRRILEPGQRYNLQPKIHIDAYAVIPVSPEEALIAAARGATYALGLDDRGSLEPEKLDDIQVWDLPYFEDIIYRLTTTQSRW